MIDYDRGIVKRMHPSGMAVCMYVDQPGQYYDINGDELSLQAAKGAGFAVERDALEAQKRKALEEFRRKLDEELAQQEATLDALASADAGSVEVRKHGKHYALFNTKTGKALTGMMTKDQAEQMAASLGSPQDADALI